MNEMVLFLVIGAAIILVALFLWSRMEQKKAQNSRVGLAQESKKMYEKMRPGALPRQANSEVSPQVSIVNEPTTKPSEQIELKGAEKTPEVKLAPEPVVEKPLPKPETVEVPFDLVSDPLPAEPKETPEVPKEDAKPLSPQPMQAPKTVESSAEKTIQTDRVVKPEEPAEIEKQPPMKLFPKEGLINFEADELTETVGLIQSVRPIAGERMLEMAANLQKLKLPIRIYVRRVDNNRWYLPVAEGRYTEMAVVLLLATRLSYINEMDASRFCVAIQQAGIALDADNDTEAAQDIVARAKHLHETIKSFDIQLSFILAAREPLPPPEVAEAARLAGFTQLNPMRYFLGTVQDISNATIFLTQDQFDRRYLTLSLDAPLARPNSRPLHKLFSVSNDLCARLHLQMQDATDAPINTEAAQAINKQLELYYKQMIQAEIEPGSPRARILFTRDSAQ